MADNKTIYLPKAEEMVRKLQSDRKIAENSYVVLCPHQFYMVMEQGDYCFSCELFIRPNWRIK